MRNTIGILLLFISFSAYAQIDQGLIAYYFFDGTLEDSQGNTINEGVPALEPAYACGLMGRSLAFNGGADEVRFDGQVSDRFNDTNDFTLSMYFRARESNGTMYLISKRPTICAQDRTFYIRYQPLSNTINVFLSEADAREVNITTPLSNNRCWHHIVVVRNGGSTRLYADGVFLQEQAIIGRIDLENEGNLVLGASDCYAQGEVPFNGFIDEMRVYNRALGENEIRDLYFAPEQIVNQDTVIFLGGSVPIELTANCSEAFSWDPIDGVSATNLPNPTITPFSEGDFIYTVSLSDRQSSCVATDSIRITVVDPNDLDCSKAFLPNVFTPNRDGTNDTYGISNPFAIQQLISFEIFDRWGSRVFATVDPFMRWDGTYRSQPVNPGIMQYKVRFICNGEEIENFGTLMIMR